MRGFPLQVHAFNGNTAETTTILPVLTAFMTAHELPEVTVVADAGMMSEANLKQIEDARPHVHRGCTHPRYPIPGEEVATGSSG